MELAVNGKILSSFLRQLTNISHKGKYINDDVIITWILKDDVSFSILIISQT